MTRDERYSEIDELVQNEVNMLRSVEHPHLLKLHSFNDTASVMDVNYNLIPMYALELEYAKHGELYDVIQSSDRFSETDARFYFKQLIDALECMHTQGFCHRDIKTENLLLDSDFNLKVADFGFSTKSDL